MAGWASYSSDPTAAGSLEPGVEGGKLLDPNLNLLPVGSAANHIIMSNSIFFIDHDFYGTSGLFKYLTIISKRMLNYICLGNITKIIVRFGFGSG